MTTDKLTDACKLANKLYRVVIGHKLTNWELKKAAISQFGVYFPLLKHNDLYSDSGRKSVRRP